MTPLPVNRTDICDIREHLEHLMHVVAYRAERNVASKDKRITTLDNLFRRLARTEVWLYQLAAQWDKEDSAKAREL